MGIYVGEIHEHPRVRELLLPRAEHMAGYCGRYGQPDGTFSRLAVDMLGLLAADLDVRTRLIAVLLGLWEECWPDGESAPTLVQESGEDGAWWLETRLDQRIMPAGHTFTSQKQANEAAEDILRYLLGIYDDERRVAA